MQGEFGIDELLCFGLAKHIISCSQLLWHIKLI